VNHPDRLHLVRVYLGFQGVIALAIGIALAFAPPRLLAGPSLVDVFRVAPAPSWGVAFGLTGLLCEVAVTRPVVWRQAIVVLIALQTMFALALTAPILMSAHANVLAPLAWSAVAGTGIIVWEYSRRLERR
jgi:hypothetical protein